MSQVVDLVFWFLFCFEVILRGFAIQFVKQKGARAPSFSLSRLRKTGVWCSQPPGEGALGLPLTPSPTTVPSGGPTPRDVARLPTSSHYLLILTPPTLYFL